MVKKLKTASGEELGLPNPERWEVERTSEWLTQIRGLGESKIERIAGYAPDLKQLIEMERTGRLAAVVGKLVLERIRGRLLLEVGKDYSREWEAPRKRKTKQSFIGEQVYAWLTRHFNGPLEFNTNVLVKWGGFSFEIDIVAIEEDGTRTAIVARRSLARNSFVDAAGIILMAREKGIANKYYIVSSREGAICTESGGGFDIHFVD